jgi:uncharacterized alkaline shock family protein YloU
MAEKKIRDDIPAVDNNFESTTEEGAVRIAENVFASIIRKYTLELPEVIKFASGSLVGSIVEMMGKKNSSKSIVIDIDNDDQVNVTVNVILKFGAHIPTVATKIQDVISARIEEITGKEVHFVNVNVVDLLVDELKKEDEEED